MTARFREGLDALGLETVAGEHPVVPLLVRDTERTARARRAPARSTAFSPPGSTTRSCPRARRRSASRSRADHTTADIDEALDALSRFTA